ncbi:CMP-N-acetylneuraminate-poly-alpha-2,8-sialyltransferase-like isoform X2 [Branchiostoma lanceolatum]|uniref:CMP-N-acetylneuraminate-poly-alpha-2, 8-sialyltransferase-like isoform X2 n=1 Tax=Branchiostoma lanceolatum TaxID=7740 RepID=UPI0034543797
MQPKLLRSLSTTARRRRCTLTMTLASALTFLAFTCVYVDSNCSRNARSFKKTVVSRVQRHALMEEDNNARIALGDVSWYSALNNRSFYIAARDNVRFEKVNKWSTWDIWPIDEAALRKIRTLSRALLPRFGMGKDEIRPDSTRLHKCVKKSRGCKLDDKNAIRHYQTCAVVGDSGILTGSHCGGEIDAHDYVIRFGVGPTAGYEDDVGTKRNITFLNKDNLLKISKSLRLPTSKNIYAQRLKRMNASTFMFAKGKNKEWNTDIKSLITIARRNNLCFTLRKNTKNLGIIIRGILSQEMPDLAQHLGGVDTTGMMSVFMASTFCHRINLYGFYPFTKDTRGKDIRYHYYDNVKPRRKGSVDNYPTEFMVNKRLHRLGVVNHVIDKCQ